MTQTSAHAADCRFAFGSWQVADRDRCAECRAVSLRRNAPKTSMAIAEARQAIKRAWAVEASIEVSGAVFVSVRITKREANQLVTTAVNGGATWISATSRTVDAGAEILTIGRRAF